MPEKQIVPNKSPLRVETLEEDLLDREPYIRALEDYLIIEHDFTDGSLVVSINAKFGSGKSTLLKMWENDLRDRASNGEAAPLVINLNAWDSDFYGEPLIPIVSELVDAVTNHLPDGDKKSKGLKEAARDAAWFMVGLANSAVPLDALAAAEFAEKKKLEREDENITAKPDLLSDYQNRRDAMKQLKDLLKAVLGADQPKAFVFIDELDRCRPDYAISYLETIKHIFDMHGIVFVLAIDYDHLANSARALYGAQLDFPEYFRKFVHRSFEMPEPKVEKVQGFAKALTDYYLHNNKTRYTKLNLRDYRGKITELITATEMSPRQSIEFFRLLGHASGAKELIKKTDYHGRGIGMMLMCAFKVSKRNIYEALGRGGAPHEEVLLIFEKLIRQNRNYWWFAIYVGGFKDKNGVYELLKKYNLLEEEDGTLDQVTRKIQEIAYQCWGDNIYEGRYPQFYKQIEAIGLK